MGREKRDAGERGHPFEKGLSPFPRTPFPLPKTFNRGSREHYLPIKAQMNTAVGRAPHLDRPHRALNDGRKQKPGRRFSTTFRAAFLPEKAPAILPLKRLSGAGRTGVGTVCGSVRTRRH